MNINMNGIDLKKERVEQILKDIRFKREKIERIIGDGIKINSIDIDRYNFFLVYDLSVELFGHIRNLKMTMKKSIIIIERPNHSNFIVKNYKDFNDVLAFYVNGIVEEILSPVAVYNSNINFPNNYKYKSLLN